MEEYIDYAKVAPDECICYKCQFPIFSIDCLHAEEYYIEGVRSEDKKVES